MKSLKIAYTLLVLCLASSLQAQDMFDAQRYSNLSLLSNARATAVGNAFGALGGNAICANINPAGMAAYPVSEFSFSFGYNSNAINSTYLGQSFKQNKYSLNIPNFSLVIADQKKRNSDWTSGNFSITANRSNTMNKSFIFSGTNNQNSVLNSFADEMNYLYFNDQKIDSTSYAGLAYYSYLIDPDMEIRGKDTTVYGYVPSMANPNDISVNQRQSINTRGNITNLNFTYAGNYKNKLMVGGTLGLPILSYTEKGTFEESNNNYAVDNYNSVTVRHRIHDQGIGIFGQVGVIFKPVHAIRLGASIKTPTFYSIQRTMNVWFEGQTDVKNSKIYPKGYNYSYFLVNPMTTTLSGAFIIKNFGFISADYTLYNGASSQLRGQGVNGDLEYYDQNQAIKKGLNNVQQLRVGAELVFGPFAVRAGESITSSAFSKGYMPQNSMYANNTTSLGFGYREAKFYVDFAAQSSSRNTFFQPYSITYTDVQGATLKERYTSYVLTLGFNF